MWGGGGREKKERVGSWVRVGGRGRWGERREVGELGVYGRGS